MCNINFDEFRSGHGRESLLSTEGDSAPSGCLLRLVLRLTSIGRNAFYWNNERDWKEQTLALFEIVTLQEIDLFRSLLDHKSKLTRRTIFQ